MSRDDVVSESRRFFLSAISVGAAALASLAVAVPLFGFLIGPLLKPSTPVWRTVGTEEDFKIGETVEVAFKDSSPLKWGGAAATTAAWLRRVNQNSFIAFAVDCTHLGCPVRWIASAELFMCPCHGGVYYKDGQVAAGPPPHALQQYPVRVQDGNVQVEWRPLPNVAAVRRCPKNVEA
jgi:menaquinol-cytochrome c reductase iron-sulfur subunit